MPNSNLYLIMANGERHFVYADSEKRAKFYLLRRLLAKVGKIRITDIRLLKVESQKRAIA